MRSVGFFNGIDLGKLRADWKAGQAVQLWTDPIALSKAVTVEIWLVRSHGLGGDGLVSNRGGGACRVGITRSERALSHSS
jgi:hypothetical protein